MKCLIHLLIEAFISQQYMIIIISNLSLPVIKHLLYGNSSIKTKFLFSWLSNKYMHNFLFSQDQHLQTTNKMPNFMAKAITDSNIVTGLSGIEHIIIHRSKTTRRQWSQPLLYIIASYTSTITNSPQSMYFPSPTLRI